MGVLKYTFYSKVLREQTNCMLMLPSYEPWRHPEGEKAYYENYGKKKTLYILHGGSDDSSLYLRRTRIEEYAAQRDLAVVFPEVRNSFYCNMIHGKEYFTYLSEELPEMLERIFPLSNKREERFVLGNSMGSHGAFKWALNRPDFFAAAAGMSGAGDLEELGFYDGQKERVLNAFGTLEEYRNSMNDFKHLLKGLMANDTSVPRLYACCGRQDPFYKGAKAFAEYVRDTGCPFWFEEEDGGHEWEFWDRWIPVLLDQMLEKN